MPAEVASPTPIPQDAATYTKRYHQVLETKALLSIGALFLLAETGWFRSLAESVYLASAQTEIIALPVLWTIVYGAMAAGALLPDVFFLVVRRRYGMERRSVMRWVGDYLRLNFVQWLAGLMVYEMFYICLPTGEGWWVIQGVAATGYQLLSQGANPLLLLRSKRRVVPLQDATLLSRLQELCRKASIHVSEIKVLTISDKFREATAVAAGLGKRRKIIMTDTLLQNLTPDEVEAIVAHELGHCANHDIPKRLGFAVLGSILAFLTVDLAGRMYDGPFSAYRGIGDIRALPVIVLLITFYYIFANLFSARISRRQERAADAYAFKLLGDVSPFITAMKRIHELNMLSYRSDQQFRYSHPPTLDRIAAAEVFQREYEKSLAIAAR